MDQFATAKDVVTSVYGWTSHTLYKNVCLACCTTNEGILLYYTSRSARLRRAYLLWRILRQACSRASAAHVWSPQLSLQLRKNVICLNWSLNYPPILVMSSSFVFLPLYTRISYWLIFRMPPAACSNTRVKTGNVTRP